jgi:hypothetical protein
MAFTGRKKEAAPRGRFFALSIMALYQGGVTL